MKVMKRLNIMKDGKLVALAQFLVMMLPFLGGIARMNRGPLLSKLIESDCRESISYDVIQALVDEAKKRHWWIIQIAPELPYSPETAEGLRKIGLRHLNYVPSSDSGYIDLLPDKDQLLMRLKAKWRNCLRKGILLGIKVTHASGNSNELDMLIESYNGLQHDRRFLGIPDSLIISFLFINVNCGTSPFFEKAIKPSLFLIFLFDLTLLAKPFDSSTISGL